jgi:hypothetical protein
MTMIPLNLRSRLARWGEKARARWPLASRVPRLQLILEWTARFGYGARGLVYLTVGIVAVLAATEVLGDAVGSTGAAEWVARQPWGRIWLFALACGLWAFVVWRVLQSVFDADHEGTDWRGWGTRAGQALSAVFYGLLASSAFEALDEFDPNPGADDVAENQEKAAALMALPFGEWMLAGIGVFILGVAASNVWRGLKSDFAGALACPQDVCRRVVPIARAGYMARGLAYLPLGLFITVAGLRESVAGVTSFGEALEAMERLPFGDWALGLTGAGLMAFGAFAWVEARWRRIRPPRDLSPL